MRIHRKVAGPGSLALASRHADRSKLTFGLRGRTGRLMT